jgi:hypothetical protein
MRCTQALDQHWAGPTFDPYPGFTVNGGKRETSGEKRVRGRMLRTRRSRTKFGFITAPLRFVDVEGQSLGREVSLLP